MPVSRGDAALQFLSEFVDHHPGLRLGKAFGMPAAFAGRLIFACAYRGEIACRLSRDDLPPDLKRRARPFRPRGRDSRTWVVLSPNTAAGRRDAARLLEMAAARTAGMLDADERLPRRAEARRSHVKERTR